MSRPYRQQRRAAAQDETRERIVKAAVALHGSIGPAATTIAALAERAGVQRLTVYRHFPDDDALFAACSSHFMAENPPPDPAAWAPIKQPRARARAGLGALYDYYARTHHMWRAVYRDEPLVPAIAAPLNGMRAYLDGVSESLARGFANRPAALTRTLRHAVRFQTWASLEEDGLSTAQKTDLVLGWLEAA